jgi:hypothetical protein
MFYSNHGNKYVYTLDYGVMFFKLCLRKTYTS